MIPTKLVQRLNPISVKQISHKNLSGRRKITLHISIFSIFPLACFFIRQFFNRPFFPRFIYNGTLPALRWLD